ncbi:hypothetical protein [Aggregatibacter actinomycetemcomitans]|uniref:hypothetical protein n=1 Tax=Aggregatibacter actinomycetemcomitans TaxID=714 RepID=UPI00197B917A|nr:hypothetical protein [Aggregatibacter actinomycetemcomitans]MBN6064345.1 hypothetical protein [Aggregatibacter actinomycetemcomitans]MBN6076704.1 hypothetical protein [Aggregatibacter actinomycetemcomitans]MBN6081828.1 hypothetical protein [Aggregatibacter actinomycetemcomitans]MBN6084281.1 hypothetical protein [Aggregatibacter actinomycetemcomitans]
MNKLILLLSMSLTLAACSSYDEIPKDENDLPPGIMQPVEGTGAIAGGSWVPEIQQQSMPINMQ